MSDHRFVLKGEFSIYGKTFPIAMSCNWYGDRGQCDERISELFVGYHDEALEEMRIADAIINAARERQELEARERRELARLSAKYGSAP